MSIRHDLISKSGLRTQLLILIFIIFVPVFSIIFYTGLDQYQLKKQEVNDKAQQLFNTFVNEQLRVVSQTTQLLKILASVPAVRNNDHGPCNQLLQTIHLENKQYSTIVTANKEGIITCCAIPLKKPIDVNDRSWFKRIKETRHFVIDNYLISRSAQKASLPFAFPILDDSGELLGAVGAAFNLNHYASIFEGLTLPHNSVVLITDRNKKLIFQSNPSSKALGQPIEEYRGFQIPDLESNQFTVEDIDGVTRIYYSKRISVGQEGNEIHLLVGFSVKEIYGVVTKTLLLNLLLIGTVLFASLIIGWLLGEKYFIRPIKVMIENAQRVRNGDFSQTKSVKKGSPKELTTLSQEFDSMVADLSQKQRDRDEATKELQINEKKYRTLFENMAQGAFYQDADGTLTNFNQKTLDIFGLTKDQFLGRTSVHPDWKIIREDGSDYPGEQHPSMLALKTGKPVLDKVAGVFNPIKNSYVWITINAIPLFKSGESAPYQAFVTLHDITDLKMIGEKLSSSQARYQQLFNYAPIPLWEEDFSEVYRYFDTIKKKGIHDFRQYFESQPAEVLKCAGMIKVVEVNRAAINLHKAGSKANLLENFQDIFTEKSLESLKEQLIILATGEVEVEIDGEVKTLSGEVIDIHLVLLMDKREDGWAQALIATIDITERRVAEEQRQLLQSQLSQAQKMETIGTLAGGIAHDFNNILSSILGYTELALDDAAGNAMLADDLKEVYTAGTRAKELVAQILAFARQSEEKLTPICFGEAIREVLQFIRSSIPSSIKINKRIVSDSLIMGNPTQIHQVMMNLCTNAAHAMEYEGGVLDVLLEDFFIDKAYSKEINLPPGKYTKLVIADTGVGIVPEIIDSIFEPYFTTKQTGEGTGMGLAMVQGIIEGYGGKIYVGSVPGEGATFTVYLPVTDKPELEQQYVVDERLALGSEKILVVDDEAPIIKMLSRNFENLGYSVVSETNSSAALELFKANPDSFDLVFSDMTMPNMTGDMLASEILAIRPDIPFILCTGYSRKISEETVPRIGIKAVVNKPIVKADLAKIVRKVLDEAGKTPG